MDFSGNKFVIASYKWFKLIIVCFQRKVSRFSRCDNNVLRNAINT